MTGLIIKDTNLLGQKNRGLGHPPEAGSQHPDSKNTLPLAHTIGYVHSSCLLTFKQIRAEQRGNYWERSKTAGYLFLMRLPRQILRWFGNEPQQLAAFFEFREDQTGQLFQRVEDALAVDGDAFNHRFAFFL